MRAGFGGPGREDKIDRQPRLRGIPGNRRENIPHGRKMIMQRLMLKSKLHRATVTDADLHYEGSISIDEQLMGAADLLPYEKVAIYDVSNGERFETYVIPGPKNCLLYTSDAADDLLCVDLGGRHIIKK